MESDIRVEILELAGLEFLQYYSRKVAVLTDFSGESAKPHQVCHAHPAQQEITGLLTFYGLLMCLIGSRSF